MTNQIQPIFVLPEGTLRNKGRDAQRTNIAAAKAVADQVKATLGPKGMDKMLVDSLGDVVITNDGVTILEEMEIEHPAAKMIVEVAKTQEKEVGDGTTTAVILSGELLKQAEELLDKNIHPTVIANGYKMAAAKAQELLKGLGKDVTLNDKKLLQDVAATAMEGKNVTGSKLKLATLAVEAVTHIVEDQGNRYTIDLDNIKIEKKEGGANTETELIAGIVIDKDRIHSNMPKVVKNAKILLLDAALEVKNTENDAKININTPEQLDAFLQKEENYLRNLVDQVVKSGANVLFCEKGIDDIAQHFLAKAGIYAVRRVKKSDMDKLARATSAKVVSTVKDIARDDLGFAGAVEERKLGDENMTFVEKCKNPKAVTMLVRGGTEHVVAEVERALKDAIGDLAASVSTGKCVPGGGAIELELARRLRKYANSLSGREQLAAQAFADSLEVVPRTLAENAGLDPIDTLADLKAKHDEGKEDAGLDAATGKSANMWKLGVIEPLKIKMQALQSASDAAIMLLRIDDIVSAGKLGKGGVGGMPPMPPGGMGGMDY